MLGASAGLGEKIIKVIKQELFATMMWHRPLEREQNKTKQSPNKQKKNKKKKERKKRGMGGRLVGRRHRHLVV